MNSQTKILLIEDDEIDAEFVKRCFHTNEVDCDLIVAQDGVEGLDRLRELHDHAPPERKILVLLDLNLPRLNGHEFLREVRLDQVMKKTVIFVLSTSDSKSDRNAAYEQNVAGYLAKGEMNRKKNLLSEVLKPYLSNVVFPPAS